LAHERAGRDGPDFLPRLQRDLIAVVGKYVEVREDLVRVNFGRESGTSTLEINIEFDVGGSRAAGKTARSESSGLRPPGAPARAQKIG